MKALNAKWLERDVRVQRHVQAKLRALPYTDHSLYIRLYAQSLAYVTSLIPQPFKRYYPYFTNDKTGVQGLAQGHTADDEAELTQYVARVSLSTLRQAVASPYLMFSCKTETGASSLWHFTTIPINGHNTYPNRQRSQCKWCHLELGSQACTIKRATLLLGHVLPSPTPRRKLPQDRVTQRGISA